MRVLEMAILHCIPPEEIYAFRLYGSDRHIKVWNYVFTHEVSSFHRWRDAQKGKTGKSVKILGDKLWSAKILEEHGVPVVPTVNEICRGDHFEPSAGPTPYAWLFLKPRHGSAGRGCFALKKNDKGSDFKVFKTRSGMVTTLTSCSCLFQNLAREPYLVQPLMVNHPDLAQLCGTQDAVTVRVITEAPNGVPIRAYCAMLEIPSPINDPCTVRPPGYKHRFHIILPIDMTTGNTTEFPRQNLSLHVAQRYKAMYEQAQDREIPFWDLIWERSLVAHSLFPDIFAIAWDIVITPDGPCLLEGNTGWGTRVPQIINGGMIKRIST